MRGQKIDCIGLNGSPHKNNSTSLTQKLNSNLFVKIIFAAIIKLRILRRSYNSDYLWLKTNKCHYKGKEEEYLSQTKRKEKEEAMWPLRQRLEWCDCILRKLRVVSEHQGLEEARNRILSAVFGGTKALPTHWFWFSVPKLVTTNWFHFKNNIYIYMCL